MCGIRGILELEHGAVVNKKSASDHVRNRLLELCAQIPPEMKFRQFRKKHLFEKATRGSCQSRCLAIGSKDL